MDNLNIIFKTKFGSHLYGTNTPDSDTDYKGIFMPTVEQICLGQIPKSINITTKTSAGEGVKNSADDIDTEIYSLHYFIKLACEGQTVALDMLHAPQNMIISSSEIWNKIVKNRQLFYTKNLKAFIGYARRQASKYGIKGSRLNDAKLILTILSQHDDYKKLTILWDKLPESDHLKHLGKNQNGIRQYQVCGKILQETQTVKYTKEILTRFYTEYGARADKAAKNKGVDWKAMSHAIRAAYQVREILTTNTITFPLKDAAFLTAVKKGGLDYSSVVAPELEGVMDEVENLSTKSDLPLKVDRSFWNDFLCKEVKKYVLRSK